MIPRHGKEVALADYHGANVVLTIDQNIQYIAEKELDQAMKDTSAVSGTVVVQNPHTGEILALANRPTFNPNLAKEISSLMLKNHAVSDVYEPGSVFKTVTYSSAIEEHLTKPDEIVSMIKAPNVVYSTTPNATMVFADFMFKTGLIKTRPGSWKAFFFPVVHNLPGT